MLPACLVLLPQGNLIELVAQVTVGENSKTSESQLGPHGGTGDFGKYPARETVELEEWGVHVDQDCQSLMALLCNWQMGQHRSWWEAPGVWDGFCCFFTRH